MIEEINTSKENTLNMFDGRLYIVKSIGEDFRLNKSLEFLVQGDAEGYVASHTLPTERGGEKVMVSDKDFSAVVGKLAGALTARYDELVEKARQGELDKSEVRPHDYLVSVMTRVQGKVGLESSRAEGYVSQEELDEATSYFARKVK